MKKARILAQRYPGAHVDVWRQSSVKANTTAGYEFGQQLLLPSCVSLTPNPEISPTLGTSSYSIPICSEWPSYQATCFEPDAQGAQDSVRLQSFPPLFAALSFPAHSHFGQSFSETPSLSTVSISGGPEAGLLESRDFFAPRQTEGFDLHTNPCDYLLQTYQDTTSYLVEYPQSGLPCFPEPVSNNIVMGGGEQFPISQYDVASNPALVSRPEEDCQQRTFYHTPWQTQQLGPNPIPNLLPWTDIETPAQPSTQRTSHVDGPPPQPFLSHEEVCFNDTAYEGQISHDDQLPLRPSRSHNPGIEVAGVGEKILAVCEDSQGTECACAGQSPDSPCSSCASPQSWVMVTYKLVKPSKDDKPKKAPKARKRLDDNARAQTSQTREVGACSYQSIFFVTALHLIRLWNVPRPLYFWACGR